MVIIKASQYNTASKVLNFLKALGPDIMLYPWYATPQTSNLRVGFLNFHEMTLFIDDKDVFGTIEMQDCHLMYIACNSENDVIISHLDGIPIKQNSRKLNLLNSEIINQQLMQKILISLPQQQQQLHEYRQLYDRIRCLINTYIDLDTLNTILPYTSYIDYEYNPCGLYPYRLMALYNDEQGYILTCHREHQTALMYVHFDYLTYNLGEEATNLVDKRFKILRHQSFIYSSHHYDINLLLRGERLIESPLNIPWYV